MTGGIMFRVLTDEQIQGVVAAAAAAPSLHNSQPWQFEVSGDALALYAAPDRALAIADPQARGLYLSCGAALYNARVALRYLGADPRVELLPHPEYPFDVLALLRAGPGAAPGRDEQDQFTAIWHRHTDRGPYSGKAIPAAVAWKLRLAADRENCSTHLLDPAQTAAVLALAGEAGRELASDELHQAELERWVARNPQDGIPAEALPARCDDALSPVRDADLLAAAPDARREHLHYERSPQLLVLTTAGDEPADWLRAGQGLEALLLSATASGLSASFLYQTIERDDMRSRSASSWPWPGHCQMIVRLGYGSSPARAPRRSLGEVMRAGHGLRVGETPPLHGLTP